MLDENVSWFDVPMGDWWLASMEGCEGRQALLQYRDRFIRCYKLLVLQ